MEDIQMTSIDEIVDALTEADTRLAEGEDPSGVRPLVRRALAKARQHRQQTEGSTAEEAGIDGPLGRVVRDLCMDIGSRTGCKVEVGVGRLPSGDGPKHGQIDEAIVEAAELLVGAFADHGAESITVSLKGRNAMTLEVGDHGTAFDPAEVGPSEVKLRELRALFDPLGGEVTWESSWRDGTTLEVSVPAD
jgi:hypothetical protein